MSELVMGGAHGLRLGIVSISFLWCVYLVKWEDGLEYRASV